MKTPLAIGAAVGLLVSVLAANYVTSRYGMVPVGFGLMATAGTYLIGLTFILRDLLHDAAGRNATLAVIAAGAVLSFLVADPFIALASAAAFALSEVADLAVYSPLRSRGYLRAAVASNVVGSVVDTVAFLAIAGFPIWAALPGQLVGKLMVTAAVVVAVVLFRRTRVTVAA